MSGPRANAAPTFTAVVVAHDSAQDLERLLSSLLRWADPAPQMVVVDTGSRDASLEVARAAGAEVVRRPENPGFGAANNAGVDRARAPVTALLNPDVELLDHGLAGLVDLAGRREALLVPALLNPDGSPQRSAHPPPGRLEALLPALVHPPLLPRAARERAEPWRARAPRRVGWAIAACLVARTDLLRRLGPFDPEAFLFFEDMDLCLRAAASGVPTELRPEVRLRHAGGHATVPAYGGEPHRILAVRRREVVARRLGGRALALDDAAQALTFATRAGARMLLGRDARRERGQLAALRAARRVPRTPGGPGRDTRAAAG
jgi:N-acetylglucosaminyl-diphospho-decaprenol L-rhamnosyltransferase